MGRTYIETLSDEEKAEMVPHADKWIEIGLRTGAADRAKFEAAVRRCYEFAGIPWPGVVVWVPSPLVMAFAAPAAAVAIEAIAALSKQDKRAPTARATRLATPKQLVDGAVGEVVREVVDGAVRRAVGEAVDGAVRGAVREVVREAVGEAVDVAVREAVSEAVGGAVDGAVRGAVREVVRVAVGDAVGGAVGEAVRGVVHEAVRVVVREVVSWVVSARLRRAQTEAVREAVLQAIGQAWGHYLGGQFWPGGWYYWGPAYTSFFRDVCHLELKGDVWERATAYEETVKSACWWWPHRRFVMVSERPTVIHRELVDTTTPRGVGSHRLHCDNGPAVAWPDGFAVYALHGVRVPGWIIETPADQIDPAAILKEQNAEVRREIVRKVGIERVCQALNATTIDTMGDYELLELDLRDGRRRPYLKMRNPSVGVFHIEGVEPGITTVQQALNWRAGQMLKISGHKNWSPSQLT